MPRIGTYLHAACVLEEAIPNIPIVTEILHANNRPISTHLKTLLMVYFTQVTSTYAVTSMADIVVDGRRMSQWTPHQ